MKIEIKEIKGGIVRVTTTDERFYQHPDTKEFYPSSTWIASYVPSKELAMWMAKKGWDEAELIKQEAGAKGSRVHKAIEVLSTGGTVHHNDIFSDGEGNNAELTAEEYEIIFSFKNWCDEVNPKFIATERTVFNLKQGYAGTLDAIINIDNELWLIDYKTSANIYLSHEAQLSSYLYSDDIGKIKSPPVDKMAILQLGYKRNKKGWKFTEIKDEYDSFLSAYHFWKKANENVSPKQKDYPREIKLKEVK